MGWCPRTVRVPVTAGLPSLEFRTFPAQGGQPFQGVLGGALAVVALQFINWRWTIGVEDFPDSSGMTALVVVDGYQWTVAIYILAFGALVGMIGSGIAASRFLDV